MAGELTKGYMGKEDLKLQTNTDDSETFERVTSVGGSSTITKFPDIWGGTGRIDIAQVDLGAKKWITGTAAPTSGTYAVGDICWNTSPSVQEPMAWVCITAGTPGTWEIILRTGMEYGFIRGLEVSYKDTDEIYVSGGTIHVNDGTKNHMLYANSQLTKQLTGLGTSEMRYIYVDPPSSGNTLVAADIEHGTTAPTYSHTKKGWYHPTTTDLRFIGSVSIDSGGDILKGYRSRDGNGWTYDTYQTLDSEETGTSWTDIPNAEKFCPAIDNAKITLISNISSTDNGNAKALYIRKNGSAATNGTLIAYVMGTTAGQYMWVITEYPVDSSGKIEYKIGPNNTNTTAGFYIQGYWEPR